MSRHLVTFIGDATMPETNPEATEVFGLVLPLGVAVPVNAESDQAKRVVAKLSANRHFKVEAVGDDLPPADEERGWARDEPVKRRGRPPKVKPDENEE